MVIAHDVNTLLAIDALPVHADSVTLSLDHFEVAKSMAAQSKFGMCAVEEWVAVSRPGQRYEEGI